MSDTNWNEHDDGAEPTAEERAEAEALAAALDARLKHGNVRAIGRPALPPNVIDSVETALRVRATERVDRDHVDAVVERVVPAAIARTAPRWYRTKWRWIAAAAAGVLAVGSLGISVRAMQSVEIEPEPAAITRDTRDVFATQIEERAGSAPIERLTASRLRSYRDVLTHTRGQ